MASQALSIISTAAVKSYSPKLLPYHCLKSRNEAEPDLEQLEEFEVEFPHFVEFSILLTLLLLEIELFNMVTLINGAT